MMEANVCDVNHLGSDVLLPPRKRLLACMKKQNSDVNGSSHSPLKSSSLKELDTHFSNLLRVHLSNKNPSQMEVVEASRSAEVAVKVAVAARAAAEEKAVIAAKAMAAAKKALELVVTIDEQETFSSTERHSMKNKTKRQVQIQFMYNNKNLGAENVKASDEQLARKLHHVINSSPRILKHRLPSDIKRHNHERLKSLSISENGLNSNERVGFGKVDDNTTKNTQVFMSKTEDSDAEKMQSKVKSCEEETSIIGRKRGRIRQKKLPLSICHDRDQAMPRSFELVEENKRKAHLAKDKPLFSRGNSANGFKPVERKSLWKFQSFKASTRTKQNKVVQS